MLPLIAGGGNLDDGYPASFGEEDPNECNRSHVPICYGIIRSPKAAYLP